MTSYIGFDISEYSSEGKEKKFGISKLGSPFLRKAAVDATKFATSLQSLEKELKKKNKN